MYNPEFSRPAQTEFPFILEESNGQFFKPFYKRVLEYFRVLWEVESDLDIKTPDYYAFRFLIK